MFERNARDEADEADDAPAQRMDSRALGIGVLIGLALGAGAALLLAPASGEDTRRHLRRNARRLYAKGSDAVEELRDDTARTARRLARRGVQRGREFVNDARDSVGW
ncbi:MAG: YtxH domain-containing protein [Gemmatimonadaceae bacterium]|nr:YtxH domain-containing protein [Gemmatimonadaceae bacterium]